jgi:hypothetical protein
VQHPACGVAHGAEPPPGVIGVCGLIDHPVQRGPQAEQVAGLVVMVAVIARSVAHARGPGAPGLIAQLEVLGRIRAAYPGQPAQGVMAVDGCVANCIGPHEDAAIGIAGEVDRAGVRAAHLAELAVLVIGIGGGVIGRIADPGYAPL